MLVLLVADSASKSALDGITRGLVADLSKHNIQVCAVWYRIITFVFMPGQGCPKLCARDRRLYALLVWIFFSCGSALISSLFSPHAGEQCGSHHSME